MSPRHAGRSGLGSLPAAEDIHTLAGAYALGALTEIERAAFARHAATCDACALDAAEFSETAAQLGALAERPAPESLRPQVLIEIARTPQVSADAGARIKQRDARTRTKQRDGAARRAPAARRWALAAAAVLLIAVAAVATVWTVQQGRIDDLRGQATGQSKLAAVLAAGDASVTSTALQGGGRLIVADSRRLDAGVVLTSDLPTPPAGHTYQLWLLTGSSAASLAVLPPRGGSDSANVATIGTADHVAMTIEPAGGSPAPTTAPIGDLPLA